MLRFPQSSGQRLLNDTPLPIKSKHGKLRNVDDLCHNYGQIEIAVPSRLRSQPSSRFPMSGIPVAIQNDFDLKGTKTSLHSRSHLQTYPKKPQSAPCIHRLVDPGAVIVGKAKLCAMGRADGNH